MLRFILPLFLACLICASAQAQDTEFENALDPLRDGIYRSQHGPYFGIVMESEDGLLVFDTFNAEFATWLDNELAQRFDKPVKYVIYSHNHADHVSGGEAFARHDPVYISHTLADESMRRMQVETRYPSVTFEDEFVLNFGDQRVELKYWGPNDGRGSISLFVPDQQVLAAIDWALTDRVAYQDLSRYNIEGMIKTLTAIDAMDWTLISPGHASTGDKADVRRFRRYLETIRDGVIAGLNAGKSETDIVEDVMTTLRANPDFTNLKRFDDWAEQNVQGAYRQIANIEGKG